MDISTTDQRAALVAGLRALADDIERSADAPLPTHKPRAEWLIFGDADQKATAATVVRDIGGAWEKGGRHNAGDFLDFTKDYGGGVLATVVVDRPQVCERIVTGTETVTIPATEATEAQPERTEVREIVEWRCSPLLAEASA